MLGTSHRFRFSRFIYRALGWRQGAFDVEDDHAEDRSVGAERDKGRTRPAVTRCAPAAGIRRAALGGASAAETVLAAARITYSRLTNLCRRTNQRPTRRIGFGRATNT